MKRCRAPERLCHARATGVAQSAVHLICDGSGYTVHTAPAQSRQRCKNRSGSTVAIQQLGHLGIPSGNNTKGPPKNLCQQLLGQCGRYTVSLVVPFPLAGWHRLRSWELHLSQEPDPAQAENVSQFPGAFLLKILGTVVSVDNWEQARSLSQVPWRF